MSGEEEDLEMLRSLSRQTRVCVFLYTFHYTLYSRSLRFTTKTPRQ